MRACLSILGTDYGMIRSCQARLPIDRHGKPLPWYTFPAIDYIKQLDLSAMSVFEYGAGYSTLFWSDNVSKVISVEDNPDWYRMIIQRVKADATVKLLTDTVAYVQEIGHYPSFDIIVIDGTSRYACAQQAIRRLTRGGFIILDNADKYREVARLLRAANLIQVDMTGLGPANPFIWTTSFFLHREFNPAHKSIGWGEDGR